MRTHTLIYTCINVFAYVFIYSNWYIYTCVYVCICVYTYIYIYIYVCVCVCVWRRIQVYFIRTNIDLWIYFEADVWQKNLHEDRIKPWRIWSEFLWHSFRWQEIEDLTYFIIQAFSFPHCHLWTVLEEKESRFKWCVICRDNWNASKRDAAGSRSNEEKL